MSEHNQEPDFDLGDALIEGANNALAFARGESVTGAVVHHAVDVAEIRKRLQRTQEQFAATFDLPVSTVRDWEQGRTQPDRAARALLRIIEREPEAALRAVASDAG